MYRLLQLLLGSDVGGVSAFLVTANHFVGIVFLGQKSQGWFNDTTTKSQHQMKSRFFLDIVIRQCSAIFQLFASKDQTLLIWRNSLLVLDLSLDIFDSVRRFNLKGDGLASQSLDENLHSGLILVTIQEPESPM